MMASDYSVKCRVLQQTLEEYSKQPVVVAFSGGVDSGLLLKLVCQSAGQSGKVYAVTMQGQLNSLEDIKSAAVMAEEFGAVSEIIEIDELSQADIAENPPNRCYQCKKYLFSRIKEFATARGSQIIFDGTNGDDLMVYRPGLQALQELDIISPLADAGFTKAEVRRLAAELGLAVADKPSRPCLATRFPYNTLLTAEALQRVAAAEAFISGLGFYNLRVRVHGDIARLEIDKLDFGRVIEQADKINSILKAIGFKYVTLDLAGFRSGSMDDALLNGNSKSRNSK